MYLIDSNIFLEVLLQQQKSSLVKQFLLSKSNQELYITDFALHSICMILLKERLQEKLFLFIEGAIKDKINIASVNIVSLKKVVENASKFNIDFDDAYQYTIAKSHNLQLVSFDKDFDKTDLKRIEP